jgi:uncharacterized protein HemX
MENQQEPVRPVEPVAQKHLGKNIVLAVLAVLAVGFGALAYWQYSEATQAKNDKASAATQVTSLKSQVTSLQSQLKTTTTELASQSTTSTKTDAEMITDVVTQYVHGQKGNSNANVTVTIDKQILPFARAQVVSGVSGFACILKKVDGTWLQLYCAQGASDYTQSQDETYEVPSSIIAS